MQGSRWTGCVALGAGLLAVSAACESSSPALDARSPEPDAGLTECGPTLWPTGKACVPLLDLCPGNRVPVPGGGCQRVGVEECKTAGGGPGIKGPLDWTCTRVGPPTTCLAGWAMTVDGWCEPVLPETDCPDGTIEVIGKSTCQPIADCGSGTWGNIVVTADTAFVDQAYAGSDSDGTQAKPFPTIGDALAAVAKDREAHIAAAAGLYKEDVAILNRPAVLEGRCPQMVTVQGKVSIDSSEATLRGLTVQSPGEGITVLGGVVELDRVAVVDCKGIGVLATNGSTLAIRDSVVARNKVHGIMAAGTTLEVDRTVVRNTKLDPKSMVWGTGVLADNGSKLTLRDSVVSGNPVWSVVLQGATGRIENSVSRRTKPFFEEGYAIYMQTGAEVEIVNCLLADSYAAGVNIQGSSKATVERTVIRDTLPPEPGTGKNQGDGVLVHTSTLVLRESVVARSREAGILVSAAAGSVDIERTLILDTLPHAEGTCGYGVASYLWKSTTKPAKLTLTDSIVANSRHAGVAIYAAEATLERTLIKDTLPRELDGYYGIGVLAMSLVKPDGTFPATLSIKDSTISGSAFSGLALYGSKATVETTAVLDTREPSPRRWGGPGVLVSSLGKAASTLGLKQSLVEKSSDFGVFVEGGQATLEGSAIRDTRTRLGDKAGGIGVYAWPGQDKVSTKLQLHDCQVSKTGTAGIYVSDAPLDVQRCEITSTAGDGAGRFGDGIVATGAKAKLNVLDSRVSDSLRCGLLAKGAGGLVDRSLLTKGALSVCLDQGAPLDLGSRLELTGNTEDRVTSGENLGTPPPPVLPPPPEMPEPPEPEPEP